MRGEVEVWSGGDLIFREANMLTDGAGELLADIMTVSPSLSGIDDLGTSSITDASNYTIQAISFGTGSDAFRENGHSWNTRKNSIWSAGAAAILGGVSGNVAISRSYRDDNDIDSSDQPNDPGFPTTPDPAKVVLEEDTNVSSNISNTDISSIFPGNGQLTNFLPSAISFAATRDVSSLSGVLAYPKVGSILGCFPEGSSVSYSEGRNQVIYFDNQAPPSSGISVESLGGYFNEVSSMDVSGFVNAVSGTATTSGLTTSSNTDFSSNGTIEYAVTLSKSDALFAHAYGGIFHLGLWTIDMKESLLNGNTPPFAFSVLNNPRKYRLFCRKGVSKDLTYIDDITAYEDLTIKWRLHFL
jgi:hypothetical protein